MRTIQKVALYILSMAFLFVIVGFLCMDIPFEIGGDFIGMPQLWDICQFGIYIIIVSILIECVVYSFLKKSWNKNTPELSVKIIHKEDLNYNILNFVASYFVPLVSFNYVKLNHWIVLSILLGIIGIIFCKSNGFYNNPTLALLGFRLYQTQVETQKIEKKEKKESLIVICNKNMSEGDNIQYVMLSDGVGVVTYINNKKI